MKTIHSIAKVLMISSVLLVSCKKEFDSEFIPSKKSNQNSVNSFKEIKVSNSFNWNNSNEVTLQIDPLNSPMTINRTLFVKTEKGEVLFSKLQKINESFIGKITVPATINKLVISYGSITKTESIQNNKVNFNFLVESTSAE